MFLIRVAFWLGLIVLLLPTDERQQARLYSSVAAAVERVTTFCDRNPKVCATGAELWAAFLKKAEFGVRMAVDLASSSARKESDTPESGVRPPRPPSRPGAQPRGTLTQSDRAPAWRGDTLADRF
jgi:Family of unknown function (DUF5330)